MTERTFDRLVQFDERSRDYNIRTALSPKPLRTRSWAARDCLDQGREGACVGFAWAHELIAVPYPIQTTDAMARTIYREAQRVDEWDGEAYEGTSVLAGAKIVAKWGFIEEYRWAFSIDDVLNTLSHFGPVVFGLPWLDSMFEPGPDGILDCTGKEIGGHAILGRGLRLNRGTPLVKWRQSWGRDHGKNGDVLIRVDDLERLLKMGGEACVPVTRRRPKSAS